eukprot:180435-Pyramimonas_sp.AAC.1
MAWARVSLIGVAVVAEAPRTKRRCEPSWANPSGHSLDPSGEEEWEEQELRRTTAARHRG